MRSVARRMGMITFNGLLEECHKKGHSQRIQYLFVDEFQDVGAFEYKFLMGLDAENVFVVGDDYQCQPGYTKVMCVHKDTGAIFKKSLVNIVPGDLVLSFNADLQELEPAKVLVYSCSRAPSLIKVTLSDNTYTEYTPTHRPNI